MPLPRFAHDDDVGQVGVRGQLVEEDRCGGLIELRLALHLGLAHEIDGAFFGAPPRAMTRVQRHVEVGAVEPRVALGEGAQQRGGAALLPRGTVLRQVGALPWLRRGAACAGLGEQRGQAFGDLVLHRHGGVLAADELQEGLAGFGELDKRFAIVALGLMPAQHGGLGVGIGQEHGMRGFELRAHPRCALGAGRAGAQEHDVQQGVAGPLRPGGVGEIELHHVAHLARHAAEAFGHPVRRRAQLRPGGDHGHDGACLAPMAEVAALGDAVHRGGGALGIQVVGVNGLQQLQVGEAGRERVGRRQIDGDHPLEAVVPQRFKRRESRGAQGLAGIAPPHEHDPRAFGERLLAGFLHGVATANVGHGVEHGPIVVAERLHERLNEGVVARIAVDVEMVLQSALAGNRDRRFASRFNPQGSRPCWGRNTTRNPTPP